MNVPPPSECLNSILVLEKDATKGGKSLKIEHKGSQKPFRRD